MTDATAGRGGVGIRLYVNGGETVKRTFDQVGDSGRKMWGEIALGQKAANPALRALSAGVGEAKTGVQGLASQSGAAGNVLSSFGASGMVAAAGLGGLAIALGKAREAMTIAADLTDTADRIGVGVEALQSWSYVADEAGVSVDTFKANLEKLNGVLGAFKSGIGDGKLKPVFEELGITKDQLQNVQTADQLMMILADTLGQVKDRALQVKFARSLGIEESLPILRMGSEGIRDLSEEAERLGLVMGKDVVQALDEADRKMEVAQQRIDATVRLAVSGLADDFAGLISQIAGAVGWLARWDAQVGRGGQQRPGRSLPSIISDTVRGRTAEEGERARDSGALNQGGLATWLGLNAPRRAAMDAEARRSAEMADLANGTGAYAEQAGGFDLQGHSTKGGSRGGSAAGRSAEQRQRERERALSDLQKHELDAQRDAIRARYGPGGTEENATELALANVTIEYEAQVAAREALRASLEKAGALDAETQVRLDQLKIAQDELRTAEDTGILQEERRRLAAERLEDEQGEAENAIDLLSIQEEMATTARERAAIARRILLAEQELERKTLAAEAKADGRVTDYERNDLRRLNERQAAEVTLFDANEQNRLREQFKGYGREVVEAIEGGRIGEYIGDQIKQRLLDGALNQLFAMISGGGSGGKSGDSGFWGTVLSVGASLLTGGKSGGPSIAQKKGMASGGRIGSGAIINTAEHGPELLLLGSQGQVTNAAETVRMFQDLGGAGKGGGGSSVPPVQINMPPISINAQGADAAGLARVERAVGELNRSLEQRAVGAVRDAQQRRAL